MHEMLPQVVPVVFLIALALIPLQVILEVGKLSRKDDAAQKLLMAMALKSFQQGGGASVPPQSSNFWAPEAQKELFLPLPLGSREKPSRKPFVFGFLLGVVVAVVALSAIATMN